MMQMAGRPPVIPSWATVCLLVTTSRGKVRITTNCTKSSWKTQLIWANVTPCQSQDEQSYYSLECNHCVTPLISAEPTDSMRAKWSPFSFCLPDFASHHKNRYWMSLSEFHTDLLNTSFKWIEVSSVQISSNIFHNNRKLLFFSLASFLWKSKTRISNFV